MRPGGVLILCAAVALGCATPGKIGVKPGYEFKKLKTVAVLGLADGEGLPGSGRYVCDRIRHHLSAAGLPLVDRDAVERELAEKKLDISRPLVKEEARAIGRALGVDAVVFGRLETVVSPARFRLHGPREKITVKRQGKFKRVPHQRRGGKGELRSYETTDDVALDISVRIVAVETGEVLAVFAANAESRGFHAAAEAALKVMLRRVERQIRAGLRDPKHSYYEDDFSTDGPEIKGWQY